MAGAGLIAIKRRIKSITNTKKITKAMGLVATAKLRKSRVKLNYNMEYHNSLIDVIKELLENYEENSIYINGNKSKTKLYIVLTSDTGLCGGFNGAVFNETYERMVQDKANSKMIVVGQKGKNYFARIKQETLAEYVEIPDLPTIKEAKEIASRVLFMYENGEVGEINIVYTKFVSAVKIMSTCEKLLPLDLYNNHGINDVVDFEPNLTELLEEAIKFYLKEEILYCMLNSKCSEQSSRMNAMDGATKNADELLEKLKLKYNRIRQSSITQEISEIVGGAEAQK